MIGGQIMKILVIGGTRFFGIHMTQGVKEEMRWIPIKELDKYKAYPTLLKDYLSKEHMGVEHIVTDERG